MELKDQILQTKERKKGFLKAMPESTRTQVDAYTKIDKLSAKYWIVIAGGAVLALIAYIFAGATGGSWVLNLIPAALIIGSSVFGALYIKSLTKKMKKALTLGAPDYVEELNAINARLFGLEKAEKARVEAEKQEARAKARAEAAQREAELALQRQQEAMQHGVQVSGQQPAPQAPEAPNPPAEE